MSIDLGIASRTSAFVTRSLTRSLTKSLTKSLTLRLSASCLAASLACMSSGMAASAADTPANSTPAASSPAATASAATANDATPKETTEKQPEEPKETVTLVRHSNKAADYYKGGDWARAKDEYRTCIGLSPRSPEYYEGLYNTCMHDDEWDQVAYALSELFRLDPSKRDALSYEYGLALFHLNKYDEAEPMLKRALNFVNVATPEYKPRVKPIPVTAPTTPVKPPPPPPKPKVEKPKAPEKPTSAYRLSYENAIRSESILIAEYEGFDKSDDIHWNNPPLAHYHIDKILKGPPLNKALPLKFEFHDTVKTAMPKGWKFSPSLMPEKGSKWILFIEFAVPKQGAFETYEGSYGRQECTEDNLNTLYQLMDKFNMRLQQ